VLPAGSRPLRILHISDLHLTPWQRGKQAWVRELATLTPDLIVNTGDNLGHKDALAALRATLDPFRGTPGVFVFGSNDYEGPRLKNPFKYLAGPSKAAEKSSPLDTRALDAYLRNELGWLSLNNSAGNLTVSGQEIEFFGVDDPHHGFDDVDAMINTLEDVRDVSTAPTLRIGVSHAPYLKTLAALGEQGADVLFAGHTHGGQVCVPAVGALTTNCDLPREQVKGLSAIDADGRSIPLHVSAGLGTSIYAPVRFACPPEATLLTLVARA
jgi:predicted MPP superfamily phosphohydrolase